MLFSSCIKSNDNEINDMYNSNLENRKEEEKGNNLLSYKLPNTDKQIHKAFNEYFERKYNKKIYERPFIEEEVLKDKNGEYLLYVAGEKRFVQDAIGCIDDFDNGPEFYVMECVERIDIKRDKSGVLTKLDVFLKHSLNTKYKILN